ncbi:MAG: BatD family protein, partial [Sphingobacteriales bacterium]
DIIRITYAAGSSDISGFRAPDFQGLRILSGPEIMPRIQIINGQVSNNITIVYVLQAIKKGKVIIPPAHFRFPHKTMASNILTINVSAQGDASQKSNPSGKGSADVFMRTELNKTHVVLGEAIAVNYKLYCSKNVGINSQTLTKMPTTGFWVEEATDKHRGEVNEEKYKGKTYRVLIVRKLILFPQKTGSLTVDPLEIECTGEINVPVQQSPDLGFPDMFDQMFNFNTVPFHKTVSSDSVKIVVDPLPDKGKPASFSGMVGTAAFAGSVNRQNVKANEPVNFDITIGGEGNLTLQQAPKLNLSADIEVYDPKITDKIDRSGTNLSGTRTFEYTLMPHKEGKYTIPSVSFSYYDPIKKYYYESKTSPVDLTVEKNDKPTAAIENTNPGSDSKSGMPEYVKWLLVFAIALILLIAVMIFVKKKVKLPDLQQTDAASFEDIDYEYYLEEAEKLIEIDPQNDFYTVILNALYGCAEQYISIPFSEITHESIRQGLMNKNVPENIVNDYITLIQACEMMKYAPARVPVDKNGIFNHAKELIRALAKKDG